MKVITILLALLFVNLSSSHGSDPHHYHCQFDSLYKDLKIPTNFFAKPDQSASSSSEFQDIHRRQLYLASRAAIRVTFDTTNFSTITSGLNGANTTTQANLNFILRTASVVQAFLQLRLQVATVSRIYAPSYCVDFSPSSNDVTNGIAGSDLHIYVQYLTDSSLSYGATGKSCKYFGSTGSTPTLVGLPDVTLQQGRPTVGRIKFNTYQLTDGKTLTSMLFQSISSTALHQITHILGFDSTLYAYYLDQATSNVYSYSVQAAATGLSGSRPATTVLTTPYVTAWAKAFFGCSSMTGMQLENQDSTGLGSGSHWQRTLMYDELMTATSFGAMKGMSALTFAILKDMGWYNVDDTFNQTTNYGYQKGCTFVNNACYGTSFTDTFCDSSSLNNISRCQTSFYGKALCTSTSNTMADGCGIYVPYYNCVDPAATDDGYRAYTLQSESTSAFCIYSTLSNVPLSAVLQSRCYPYVCSTSSVTFTIGSYSITCLSSEAGVNKTLSALNGQLTCPVFADFCTNSRKSCPNWCSQNGYCMRGVCNCLPGYSGLDCSIQSCTSTTYYYSTNNSCLAGCPTGTYQDIYTKSCRPCNAICSQCRNQPTICIACVSTIANPMYFYNTTQTCSSTCLNTTYLVGDICYDCSVAVNCKTCSMTATNCTSCLNSLYLSTPTYGTCGSTCTGNNTLYDKVNKVCTYTCQTNLVLTNGNQCNLCSNGTYKFVSNQSCIVSCPNTYYPDTLNQICLTCDSSCLNCDDKYPQNCTKCNPSSSNKFLLLKMCLSICPRGFYQNTTAGACQICTIGLNCATCVTNAASLIVNCTTCSYGFYFQNNVCGTSCTTYYYKNTWNNTCSACSLSCGDCNGPSNTSCTSCRGSLFLINDVTGSYCLNACPTIGYVTSSTNCLACDSTCATCNGISASNCVTCASGYYLSSSTCRLVCPGGTYPNSTTQQCQPCDGSCTYCFGSTINNCSQCITGMVLYNFTCQGSCPNGLTANQWNVCYADNLMNIIGALLVLSMILMQ